jgi:hypothetical protein
MKPFSFSAAKAAQRADLFVADERLDFIATEQPTGDGFQIVKSQSSFVQVKLLNRSTIGEAALRALAKWLSVWHVLVGMKMLGFAHDILRQIADVAHERVTRELCDARFRAGEIPIRP